MTDDDWIRARVIARANELGLTAYGIAKATEGRVSTNHIRCYLAGEKSLTSSKLQHVLTVLGLQISSTSASVLDRKET